MSSVIQLGNVSHSILALPTRGSVMKLLHVAAQAHVLELTESCLKVLSYNEDPTDQLPTFHNAPCLKLKMDAVILFPVCRRRSFLETLSHSICGQTKGELALALMQYV
ncbi:uncharacterized protein LOC103714155 [Phoenix dactylifera]|uniref:Uncharacterized protein LOC103714155 n=1 Tax=Phoenix dactylifera TaxID=42345 RepID=A0A8B8ZUQ1_PHODC|nr:uncharacterized protein LOC103714155 [Phoenix dactylifera]XP_038978011.1 uncharacterized protein LOC103714155 [Phoenix dactylifera]